MPESLRSDLNALGASYQNALRLGDIEEILKWGEAYYKRLRNGELTSEDREAIQNDLLIARTMDGEDAM